MGARGDSHRFSKHDRSRAPARGGTRGAGTARRGPDDLGLGVRLVFEDDEILVVDKPIGLVTAPVPGVDDATRSTIPSVFGVVKSYARSKKRRGARVWIIHRLDKEASGLLVFAKTERAFEWLKEDFRSRRVHRLYLAVVEGEFPAGAGSGTIQNFVIENERGLMQVATGPGHRPAPVPPRTPRGPGPKSRGAQAPGPARPIREHEPQLAVTHYRVLAQGLGRSVVQVRLSTGRKNQIRVHMADAGHPLVGDYRYRARGEAPAAPISDPLRRLCLHATELGFAHPSKGETVRFASPEPPGFWGLVGAKPRGLQPPGETPAEPAAASGSAPSNADVRGAQGPTSTGDPSTSHRTDHTRAAPETSWDHVAEWYEQLLGEGRSDHHRDVIIPGTLRLLKPSPGMRVLDVACGQGVLCHRLSRLGVEAVGVDASAKLIAAARKTAARSAASTPGARFEVGDARAIQELALPPGTFDAVACVMALMNIDPLEPVLRGCAAALKPGGVLVAVVLHPAFRAPGQTSWGFDKTAHRGSKSDRQRDGTATQIYRRIDGYLSPGQTPIVMNPGRAAHGHAPVTTWTFHRPVQTYVRLLAEHGFLLEALEEWPSLRQSEPGPRAREENRIRREIPMFLGWRAVRRG